MATTDSTPRLKAPPGACDTHMHFYDARYPTAKTALITPPDASVADYRKLQARLGLTRNVVVQPTTYGTDNRCTLEAMAALGPSARGVAAVDTSVTDAELERLTKAGIRGVRFHMLPGGALPWDMLETMAARVGAFGWHVQLQLDGKEFPEREARLKKLPGTLVVDHIGKFLQIVPPSHEKFSRTGAAGGGRQDLREAVRALRILEVRAAGLCRCRRAGEGADRNRTGAHAVGEQLAAPFRAGGPQAGRRDAARYAAVLGGRRRHAAEDLGGQSGEALRLLKRRNLVARPRHHTLPIIGLRLPEQPRRSGTTGCRRGLRASATRR